MPRLLALDGGGAWALLQVRALMDLYGADATGFTVLRDFDLVTATSGGSIVAGAIAADWPLQRALDLFHDAATRKSIFVKLPWYQRLPSSILDLGPKYGTGPKFEGLTRIFEAFATSRMDALPALVAAATGRRVDFVITAFDYDRCRSLLFRSNPASRAASRVTLPVSTICAAIHASSTAPVNYFNEPATLGDAAFDGFRFWDGAISGMNNPVMVGITELLANGAAAASIEVLSLGTGSVRLPISAEGPPLYQRPVDSGLITDVKEVALAVLDDPPDTASYQAHIVLGLPLPAPAAPLPQSSDRFVRLSPLIQPVRDNAGQFTLPAVAGHGLDAETVFTGLTNLAIDAIEDDQITLIDTLGDAWFDNRVYNQPIRTNLDLACEIGHRWYRDGAAAWHRTVGH